MNQVSPAEEILEVVEIEIFALEEKPLPRARHYVIRVDKEKVAVDRPEITGAEIRWKSSTFSKRHKFLRPRSVNFLKAARSNVPSRWC